MKGGRVFSLDVSHFLFSCSIAGWSGERAWVVMVLQVGLVEVCTTVSTSNRRNEYLRLSQTSCWMGTVRVWGKVKVRGLSTRWQMTTTVILVARLIDDVL